MHFEDDIPQAPAVICALDGHASRHTTAFAAGLARRLEWRLSLVPLGLDAPRDRQRARLVAAVERDGGRFIVAPATAGPWAQVAGPNACLAVSRDSGVPVIAVPRVRRASALGSGPVVCAVGVGAGSGGAPRTADELAHAIGEELRLLHVVQPNSVEFREHRDIGRRLALLAEGESAALLVLGMSGDGAGGRIARAVLMESRVPVMLVPAAVHALARAA